jgi:hypothetical protein
MEEEIGIAVKATAFVFLIVIILVDIILLEYFLNYILRRLRKKV